MLSIYTFKYTVGAKLLIIKINVNKTSVIMLLIELKRIKTIHCGRMES